MYRQSNIPWEEKKPLPPKYCTVFSMLKTPYYPEEKEFYEKNHKEDDPLKGLIIVFYNPSTGKAAYAIPDRFGYVHGNEWDPNAEDEDKGNDIMQEIGIPDGRFDRVSLNIKQLRKKGYRQTYVERQEVMIDGRSCLMLRVYTQYCRILKARPEPDTLRENYRIIICRDECWEETREGVKKSQWGEGGCGWNKYLKNARWYDDEFQGERAKQGEELYERTIGPAKISWYMGVWETLVAYSQLPKKSFVYKNVPAEIKEDLEAFSPGIYHHLSAEDIKKARIGSNFIVLQFLKYSNLIERVYVTKDHVYPFIENPWTDRFCSSAVSRRIEIFGTGATFFYADLPDGSHLKGVAALAYQIISGRKWINDFVLTLKNASRRVYQEQALKMGWYNAASSLNHVTSKDCPDNAGLAEIMGVKGSMLKHIGDTSRVVDLVKGREELQGMIKKAQMQNICPDLTVLYSQIINYNCNAMIQIFKHYVEHGKSFGPFMYALRKRDGNYYDKKHLIQEYYDYIEQASYVNEIIPGSFPLFLKPSEVHDMHAQATSSYRRIRERDRLDKIAGKFTAAVKSEDYQSLCAEDEEFCIMTPQKPDDLIHEGAMLHHCVGGYIDRVADKLSKIFFLRNKKTPDTPYCTIELVGNRSSVYMNQCYNAYDRHDDNADRISFIKKWAKEKGIRIACAIAPFDFETRMQPAPAVAQDGFINFDEEELPFG